MVVASSNTNDLANFLERVCSEVYYYIDGSEHMCRYQVIKDVLKKAKELAWENKRYFCQDTDLIAEERRGIAAIIAIGNSNMQ